MCLFQPQALERGASAKPLSRGPEKD